MNNLENKLKAILEERETIIAEVNELHNALTKREERLIQISGSIITLQELLNETKEKTIENDNESDVESEPKIK